MVGVSGNLGLALGEPLGLLLGDADGSADGAGVGGEVIGSSGATIPAGGIVGRGVGPGKG